MKVKQWQRVESIFHAAVDLGPEQRSPFLDSACGNDPDLRKEVESLLEAYLDDPLFINDPAVDEVLALLGKRDDRLEPATRIAGYQIIKSLGAGGMGEVYLATDLRLGRDVALKVLPAGLAKDESRLRRFFQEARAASSLNHPNIMTVYEIGADGEVEFIATEYIDGVTVRTLISTGPIALSKALEIAVQVASALSTAHSAGIVHRDIKPENVMLRGDGYVKVVDFGLAKLTGTSIVRGTDSTLTEPGAVMGTVSYMSPEHVRGLDVDGRTDIWSLGVLLYETLCGQAPFTGSTAGDIIASILEHQRERLDSRGVRVPEEMERILARALNKERERRYQSAAEMLQDLQSLKDSLGQGSSVLASPPAGPDGHLISSTAVSTRNRRLAIWISAAILFLLAAAIIGTRPAFVNYVKRVLRSGPASMSNPSPKMTSITTTGQATRAAISPDGKFVAFVTSASRAERIEVRQVATSNQAEIPTQPGLHFTGVTFSNDSNYIYYVAGKGSGTRSVYRVSVLGGESKKILENVSSPISFAPDGQQFVFERDYPRETALIIAGIDGTERELPPRRFQPQFYQDTGPAWSPDGKVIATAVGSRSASGAYEMTVIEKRVDDGSEREITDQKWRWIGQLAWTRDGEGLVMPVAGRESTLGQIIEIPYRGGRPRAVTNDLTGYLYSVSVTSDSQALVAVSRSQLAGIWVTAPDDLAKAEQITPGRGRYLSLAWTPAGRIVYVSAENGNWDIWIMDADGSRATQLTDDPAIDYSPAISADGKIIFVSNRSGSFNIWSMDSDGANTKHLTRGEDDYGPQCSADGWVFYTSLQARGATLWKVPINGGEPIQLGESNRRGAAVSPDGRLLACFYFDETRDSTWVPAIFSAESMTEPPQTILSGIPATARFLRWVSTDQLSYVSDHILWSRSLTRVEPEPLINFGTDEVFGIDWSPRDHRLAYVRGIEVKDVIYITDFAGEP